MDDDDLLAEQRSFYRARAPEYDEWWLREGRYDRGAGETREWHEQVVSVEAALTAFGATGDVLELAGGTGWWTARLAETADRLTVVDSSPETLALNRARVGRPDVEYVVADVFEWEPTRSYDVVFFSFWLSHVPRPASPRSGRWYARAWRPAVGCSSSTTAPTRSLGRRIRTSWSTAPTCICGASSDGSEFRVVKVMYEPDELQSLIEAEGWRADIHATRAFVFGSAQPI